MAHCVYGYGYIHGYPRKICGYGYGYGWEISYPRQPCLFSYVVRHYETPVALQLERTDIMCTDTSRPTRQQLATVRQ